MAKLPIDDIFKAALKRIEKEMLTKANKQVRYELLQKTKNIATTGASKIGAKPKPKVKPKVKPTVSGKPVGKIAKTTPARPKRDYYAKGKTVAQNESEKRAAERQANRMLRQSGFNTPKSKPVGNAKPVDVKGSIIQPPSKATMRSPKPKSSSYEADKVKAQIKADREKFRGGQKPPKGKGKPPKGGTGSVKVKPTPKPPSGAGGATATAKRLQDELKNATTPAQRLAARKKLMNHILSTGSRRSKNIYK